MKRLLSILLAFMLVITPVNMDVFAQAASTSELNMKSVSVDPENMDFDWEYFTTEEEFMKKSDTGIITFGSTNATASTGLYGSQLTGKTAAIYKGIKKAGVTAKRNSAKLTVTCKKSKLESTYLAYRKVCEKAMYAYYYDYVYKMHWATNGIGLGAKAKKSGSKYKLTIYFIYEVSDYYTSTVNSKANAVITKVVKACKGKMRYEQIKYFHDWLVNNNTYDMDSLYSTVGKKDFYYAHSALGCLINKKGVCESYAKAFKCFCAKAGIPCVLVISDDHMWNYVKMLNGKWYMVDCTYDDPVADQDYLLYNYFLVSNEPNDSDHEEESLFKYPVTCSKDYTPCSTHTVVTDQAVAATNTSTGKTEGSHCSVCKETLTAQKTVAVISKVTLYKGVDQTYKLTSNKKASWKIKSGKAYASLKGATLTVKKTGTVKVYDKKSKKTVKIIIKTPSTAK